MGDIPDPRNGSDIGNVLDFGAAGDGTTDDSRAFAAAVAAHKVVEIPAGTFLIEGVSVPADTRLFSRGGTTIRLKPQASFSFTPIFILAGGAIQFEGIGFDGNRARQPADGFSDSWNNGPSGQGRRNRAGIVLDGAYAGLTVLSCDFFGFYAASIATRDVSDILVQGCRFHDSNLEGCFLTSTRASDGVTDVKIVNNSFRNIYSGHASVNGNCVLLKSYDGVIVSGNHADNFERNLVKLEQCKNALVTANQIANNRVDTFNTLQAQHGGENLVFSKNLFTSVKAGIYLNAGRYANVAITDNFFNTVTSNGAAADAIQVSDCTNLVVSGNHIHNAKRYGIYCPQNCRNVTLTDNVIEEDRNSGNAAIMFSTTASFDHGNLKITGNTITGKQSANDGIISILGTGSIGSLQIVGNSLVGAGAANNRALWASAATTVKSGLVSGNFVTAGLLMSIKGNAGSAVTYSSNRGARCYFKGILVEAGT